MEPVIKVGTTKAGFTVLSILRDGVIMDCNGQRQKISFADCEMFFGV